MIFLLPLASSPTNRYVAVFVKAAIVRFNHAANRSAVRRLSGTGPYLRAIHRLEATGSGRVEPMT